MDQLSFRDGLSAAYAAGALDPAFLLLIDTHAALRTSTRAQVQEADAVAGAFFEAQSPAAMADGALAAVFAQIDQPSETPQQMAARAASSVISEVLGLPDPVHGPALDALCHGGWTFAGPGLRTLPLDLGGDAKAEIIRIEPGWGSPRHTHRGAEYTLVMRGAFHDERGAYGVGDIAIAGPDVTHSPIADKGEVCYALAITEAPLEFTGALGLLQRIWRH
jgi:putative transcriptional regulator